MPNATDGCRVSCRARFSGHAGGLPRRPFGARFRASALRPPRRGRTIAGMSDEHARLVRAAGQILRAETDMAGGLLPRGLNPLPEIEITGAGGAMSYEQKAAALHDMDVAEVKGCSRCALSPTRTNTVFGEGSPDADLVFVGEGPGSEEDRTGRPFVGRAGELLTKMIEAMGLRRADVFICNMVKCRPPNNRDPMPEEVQACWGYLVRQLEIIRPTVIVTMGNPATRGLLNTREGITRLRGTWQELPALGEGLAGTAVMPTFHPAYILRRYNADTRGKAWSDLQQVMVRLGLPETA